MHDEPKGVTRGHRENPPLKLATDDFAQELTERFESMREPLGDEALRQVFKGAKRAIPKWLDPETEASVRESYALAEGRLFPQTSKK